ncbi:MAG: imidazole glycerol phosphate synthase cyclase subunit [Akkermansiaceae bacterium]|nr:imidazole glycerol phosphate synthase cyclase subunit [Akkermansiaceae bacterium]
MQNLRIIPRLDIKGPNLVKGIHFEGLRVMGKPEAFARFYYEQGADELLYIDAVASLYGRNSLLDIVKRTSEEIFIPFCVGGGLRSVDDIRQVLRAGADKVSLNTSAIADPKLISEASRAFGSSTIVISIEAVRQPNGRYECLTDYGRETSGVDAYDWARRAEDLGAGEVMITSIDREGTGEGFDLDITGQIASSLSIPVIAGGGAGSARHVQEVVEKGKADAVAIAGMFHYDTISRITKADESLFATEGNVEFLQGRRGPISAGRLTPCGIPELKDHLHSAGIACRNLSLVR